MGNIILRGISSALVVTVITLLAGMFWSAMGFGGLNPSSLVDIGLAASCLVAGYRSGKESGVWILGGVSALGYVSLAILLTALFLPISGWGAAQILAEGVLMGILAGAVGAGRGLEKGVKRQRNKWDAWDRWDSSGDFENKESIDSREISHDDDFTTSADGEWEDWMSEDLRQGGKEEERTYKQHQKDKEMENRIALERKRWWEEDVF